jgi:ABC-type nickel/cobalt efflux system permease component RcnA
MIDPSLIQIHPLAGGIIAGLVHVLLGPDHLCTIITLSACQGVEAFWFGVRWAGGHLSGMAVIGLLFVTLNYHNFSMEMYEHYAYYCVGFMLMFIGVYFIVFADKYFDEEWSPKQESCACHSKKEHSPEDPVANDPQAPSYGTEDLKKNHHGVKPIAGFREMGSVLVGFVQGIACPAGVVGMVFLKQYGPTEMCVFIVMFFIVTTLTMGLLAMTYGILTRNAISSAVLGRTIYYASCGLSLTLGAVWVVLNATNRLDEWLGHDHDHAGHDHAGHEHGHHHHHHLMMQQESLQDNLRSPLPNLFLLAR